LLEKEIIPLFYDRGRDNIPRRWIEIMKNSMAEICPVFNTNRMIREYTERFYLPAQNKFQTLFGDDQKQAKELAKWKTHVNKNWPEIQLIDIKSDGSGEQQVDSEININVKINLGKLTPADVSVEIYHGYIRPDNKIADGDIEIMTCSETNGDNVYSFAGIITCHFSGLYGYTVRVIPKNANLAHPHETGLILWADK